MVHIRIKQQIARRSRKQRSRQREDIRRRRRRHLSRREGSQHFRRRERRRERGHGCARGIERRIGRRNINGGGEICEQRLVRELGVLAALVCVDGSEEDVVWFDVAVHDAGDLVQPVQAGDKLARELLVRGWALDGVEHCCCCGSAGARELGLLFDV